MATDINKRFDFIEGLLTKILSVFQPKQPEHYDPCGGSPSVSGAAPKGRPVYDEQAALIQSMNPKG